MPKMGYCFGTALSETGDRLLVAAGYRALHSFDVTKEGDLALVSTVYEGGYYRYVELLDDRAYVASSQRGLSMLDVAEDEPTCLWAQSDSLAYGIHIEYPLACVAAERDGLFIFDISVPEAPQVSGHTSMPGRAWDVWEENDYVFVADADRGLVVVHVLSPRHPQPVSTLSWGPDWSTAEIIDGQDGFVYIAAGEYGLVVVDVRNPANLTMTYRYDPGSESYGESVKVSGDTLYATIEDGSHPEENGLHVFNVKDPAHPALVGKIAVADFVEDVSIGGSRLAVANTQSGVVLCDIQTPEKPRVLATYPSAFWRTLTARFRW